MEESRIHKAEEIEYEVEAKVREICAGICKDRWG